MSLDTVSILDGSTFVVSDRRGDLDATPTDNHGLFLEDTRFLSRWILTVGGIKPKTLSVDEQAYFKVQFFEAVTTGTVYVDSHLSVMRRRCVSNGFEETIEIENHGKDPVDLDVKIEVGADFADLFEVKDKLAKVGEFVLTDAGATDTMLVMAKDYSVDGSQTPATFAFSAPDGTAVCPPAVCRMSGRSGSTAGLSRRKRLL